MHLIARFHFQQTAGNVECSPAQNHVSVVKVGATVASSSTDNSSSSSTASKVVNGSRKTSTSGSFTLRSSVTDANVTKIAVSSENNNHVGKAVEPHVNGSKEAVVPKQSSVKKEPAVPKQPVVSKESVIATETVTKQPIAKDIVKPQTVVKSEVPVQKPPNKDSNHVTTDTIAMDTKVDSASEEKIDFSAARNMFETNPAKSQGVRKVSGQQQMYTVVRPASNPQAPSAPSNSSQPQSAKGKAAPWQQQLKKLASNNFSVQNTTVRPAGIQKATSVDQSTSSLTVNLKPGRQLSLQEQRTIQQNGTNEPTLPQSQKKTGSMFIPGQVGKTISG